MNPTFVSRVSLSSDDFADSSLSSTESSPRCTAAGRPSYFRVHALLRDYNGSRYPFPAPRRRPNRIPYADHVTMAVALCLMRKWVPQLIRIQQKRPISMWPTSGGSSNFVRLFVGLRAQRDRDTAAVIFGDWKFMSTATRRSDTIQFNEITVHFVETSHLSIVVGWYT